MDPLEQLIQQLIIFTEKCSDVLPEADCFFCFLFFCVCGLFLHSFLSLRKPVALDCAFQSKLPWLQLWTSTPSKLQRFTGEQGCNENLPLYLELISRIKIQNSSRICIAILHTDWYLLSKSLVLKICVTMCDNRRQWIELFDPRQANHGYI